MPQCMRRCEQIADFDWSVSCIHFAKYLSYEGNWLATYMATYIVLLVHDDSCAIISASCNYTNDFLFVRMKGWHKFASAIQRHHSAGFSQYAILDGEIFGEVSTGKCNITSNNNIPFKKCCESTRYVLSINGGPRADWIILISRDGSLS